MFTTRTPHGHSPQLLGELGTAELFVLSSLRLWFLSHCDRDHEYPDWRQAFQAVRIHDTARVPTVPASVGSRCLH